VARADRSGHLDGLWAWFGEVLVDGAGRFTCWVGRDDDRFERVARLLSALGAPAPVAEAQTAWAAGSTVQGVGVAVRPGGCELRLYVDHRPPGGLRRRADSWRWTSATEPVATSYEFSYLPLAPGQIGPAELAHPVVAPVVAHLLEDRRLQALSGFWTRRTGTGVVDQVDVAYPWFPVLGRLAEPLRALSDRLGVASAWIDHHAEHPVAHVAVASAAAAAPAATIYFAGDLTGSWPSSPGAAADAARADALVAHGRLERELFDRLPALPPAQGERLDRFYSSTDLAAWRQVLGDDLHYHFGLFDAGTPFEAGMERAVTELYPFIPPRSRVYDLGCGWGGPARMLARDLECDVVGATVSQAQFEHVAALGLAVRYGDVESFPPPGRFDVILALESLSLGCCACCACSEGAWSYETIARTRRRTAPTSPGPCSSSRRRSCER
jgi:hypothetical protein